MAMQNRRDEEKGNLTDFLADKCMSVRRPLNIKATIFEYMEASGTGFGFGALRKMVDEHLKIICRIRVYDRKDRVEQLFGLSVSLDRNTLKELREHADVGVDKRGRIVKYSAHDGSLNLLGSHAKNYRALQNAMALEEAESDASVAPPAPKRSRLEPTDGNTQSTSTPAVSQSAESSSRPAPQSAIPIEQENFNLPAVEQGLVKQEDPEESSMEKVPMRAQNVIQPDVKPVFPQEQQQLVQPRQNPQIPMERAPEPSILPLAKHEKALRYMKNMMEILNLKLPALETKIDRKIFLIESDQTSGTRNEEKLKIADFQNIIMTSVSLARAYACDVCEGEFKSLREFILLINMGIRTLRMGEMDETQKKVQESMDEPEYQYKVIPVAKMPMLVQIIVEILCGF